MPESHDPEPGQHHHHGPGGHRTTKDYVDDFFANWRSYEGSLADKVALTVKNRARAFLLPPIKGCCGHPGEPGC